MHMGGIDTEHTEESLVLVDVGIVEHGQRDSLLGRSCGLQSVNDGGRAEKL